MFRADASLLTRIGASIPLSAEERALLLDLREQPTAVFPRGADLLRPGEVIGGVYLLRSGCAAWQQLLHDGGRQVFAFLLPGDVIGLSLALLELERHRRGAPSIPLDRSMHVTAASRVEAAVLSLDAIDRLFRRSPGLGAALAALTTVEISRSLRRHLTNAGRRNARARLADLLLEFRERQQLIDRTERNGFPLPVPQVLIADALALTPVHVSRVLAELQRDGVVRIIREYPRRIVIPDLARLRQIAGWEDDGSGPGPRLL